MSSGTPSEELHVSLSDTESFMDIQATSSPRASAQDLPIPATETAQNVSSVKQAQYKHPKYYFDDGSVLFLVGGLSYRVHRYLFSRESPYWSALLPRESNSDTFDLADKDTHDFDAFLDVLYSTCYRSPDISTTREWSAVLRLATEWSFDGIRALAVERLEPIASPIEKLVLSYSHAIAEWRSAAYTALCARNEPLTASEVAAMQAEDVALIMSVRETLLREGVWPGTSVDYPRVAEAVAVAMEPGAVGPEEAPPAAKPTSAPALSSSVDVATDNTSFTASPTTFSDFYADISGLLDVLGEETFLEVATEITRWINSGNNEHGYTVLEYTADVLFDKVARGDGCTWHAKLCGWLVRELPERTSAFATRDVQKYLFNRFLAKMEGIRSRSESVSSATSSRDTHIANLIGELSREGLLVVADFCEVLEASMPNAPERERRERQLQLFCQLLSAAAPHVRQSLVRTNREDIRLRMDRCMSAIRDVKKAQVNYGTESVLKDALKAMSRMGWR
ncbi:hypothetical protein PsYK624_154570 [Phanerochaete sordida]|uniref:BTB domain-containing protein n=1 Tax=Phanerochaete sordida TaxID=48140 RepID=A0A9P3LL13_9APHY|nr:hypothetical protein PsYK624_154570 [Phanerochaete sordida]